MLILSTWRHSIGHIEYPHVLITAQRQLLLKQHTQVRGGHDSVSPQFFDQLIVGLGVSFH